MARPARQHLIPGRSGFTLVELVLSLAIVSILLGAMGSLVLVASKSLPDATRSTDRVGAATGALEQLSADLAAALTIVEATDKAIEFTVPDRDKDGQAEHIRYEWSGTAGTGLERSYKGGGASTIASPVANFALSYVTTTTNTSSAATISNAAESIVAAWTGGALYFGKDTTTGTLIAQNFAPSLPAGARSWTVTKVRFNAKADLDKTGVTEVQLRTTSANGTPTSTVLASATCSESSLGATYGMREVTFSGAPPLAPGQEVSLVFVCKTDCPSITMGYYVLSVVGGLPMYVYDGSAWSSNSLNVIPHEVFATAKTSTGTVTVTNELTRATARLRIGRATDPEVRTSVQVGNTPEVQ